MKIRTYPVSRVQLELADGGFDTAVTEAVKWIAKRCGTMLPEGAFNGEPFDTGLDAQAPAVAYRTTIDGGDYWAAKLRFPDNRAPGRLWLIELVLSNKPSPIFCVRLALKDSVDQLRLLPPTRSIPGLSRQLIDSVGASDGGARIEGNLLQLETLEDFNNAVIDREGKLPILLFGVEATEDRSWNIGGLATELAGVCHVGVLGSECSWSVTQSYDKQLSVYGRYARLYYPIDDVEALEPYEHPLFNLDLTHRDRLKSDVIGACLRFRAPGAERIPRFLDIAGHVASLALSNAQKQGGLSEVEASRFQAQIEALEEENANLDALLDEAGVTLNKNDSQIDSLTRKSEVVMKRLDLLKDYVASLKDRSVPESPPSLSHPSAIEEWCELAGAGRLVLSKEFLKSFKQCPDDTSYLYRVAVAIHGIAQVTTGAIAMTGKNLPVGQGVEVCPVGDTEGFDYSFMHGEEKYESQWHAKWGNGRDIRHAFRIYYHWDKDTGSAILHCFTTHLDNKSTN